MKIHVLIATARRSDLLKRTLESLVACSKPVGYSGMTLVENGGRSGADELLNQYTESLNTHYLFEPVGNKNRSINRGLKEIDADLVVLYDDDVRIDPGSLVAYAEAAERWPQAPFFGGCCACDYEEVPAEHVLELLPSSARGWALHETGDRIELPVAMGFNWAVRPSLVEAIGGFVEDRGPGTKVIVGDETDMQQRMINRVEAGRYVANAKVWHYVPTDRCSEEWLISRSYHNGYAKAIAQRDSSGSTRIPMWVRKRLWKSTLKWWLTRAAADPETRFCATFYRQAARGMAAGFRQPIETSKPRITSQL